MPAAPVFCAVDAVVAVAVDPALVSELVATSLVGEAELASIMRV